MRSSRSTASHDRQAILQRRAALIASALSGLCVRAATAEAQPAPVSDECAGRAPSAEDLKHAKQLTEAARAAFETGDYASAAKSSAEAYAASSSDEVALLWMDVNARAGRPEEAIAIGASHKACGGDAEKIAAKGAEIEAKNARVIVVISGPRAPTATILLDGVEVKRDRAAKGLLVSPGSHVFSVRTPEGLTNERRMELAVNDSMTLDLVAPEDRKVIPYPCLSPPPPRELAGKVRVTGGLIVPQVAVAFGTDNARVFGGGGIRVAITARITDRVWFEGDAYGTALASDQGQLVYAGASAGVLLYINDVFGTGGALTAGKLFQFANDDASIGEGGLPFVGPVAIPMSLWFGPAELQLRIPVCFTIRRDGDADLFAATISPYLALSFGGPILR